LLQRTARGGTGRLGNRLSAYKRFGGQDRSDIDELATAWAENLTNITEHYAPTPTPVCGSDQRSRRSLPRVRRKARHHGWLTHRMSWQDLVVAAAAIARSSYAQ